MEYGTAHFLIRNEGKNICACGRDWPCEVREYCIKNPHILFKNESYKKIILCKECDYWVPYKKRKGYKDQFDGEWGFCKAYEDDINDKVAINDITAYRPALETRHDFGCILAKK